ncbi:MAG: epoxide hydrolase [Gammaproteobacteria bacterium]|jgi:epoxide hydrolase|nr:epoxide hydrolase [Gammaproteobacteria bacterium]
MVSITSNFQRLIATSTVSFLAFYYASSVTGDPLDLSQQFKNNRDVITSTMNNQAESFANNSITPFQISISDEDLEDLQLRLSLTRLPDQLNNISWEYGTDLNYMRELIGYWQDGFDWREQERELNQFDQFKTVVDDLNLHFIHQRSNNPDAIPLMVVHGWPGSVAEFSKIIRPLTDPLSYGGDISDSFHVIAPSLPGFGFSGIPDETGYSPERIALLLAELMEKIGYERYAIAGGDWGAIINRHLANHYPDRLIGLHSNMMLAGPPSGTEQRANVTEEEDEARTSRQGYMQNEVAYQQIQGTKPQTLGYGLNDSPAGVAAWIVEKFHGWTDMPQGADGYLDNHFTKDELLTNIAIYWFTNTITSSTRIYLENRNTPAIKPMEFINVPTGAAIFPAEIFITPRSWAEASYDLRHWTVMEEGGHFAALEQPELYLNDLREFFRLLR